MSFWLVRRICTNSALLAPAPIKAAILRHGRSPWPKCGINYKHDGIFHHPHLYSVESRFFTGASNFSPRTWSSEIGGEMKVPTK